MTVPSALAPAGVSFGSRFFLVSYLPTLGCAVFLLTLVWAGAPGADLDLARAWRTAARLSAEELFLLWLAITLVSIAGHPLQLWLVRVLEGGWPRFLKPAQAASSRWQGLRRSRLSRCTVTMSPSPSRAEINRAGAAQTQLRLRYPPEELSTQPTALGNVLAAMEYFAGSDHGLDAVVTWPRLYPLLRAETKAVVDDHRDIMDAECRLAVTAGLTASITTALVWRTGGLWLVFIPALLILARVAYRAAVRSAIDYAIAVDAAIDTHRFQLYQTLHLPFPSDPSAERELNARLSLHWRQNHPNPAVTYRQPDKPDPTPQG